MGGDVVGFVLLVEDLLVGQSHCTFHAQAYSEPSVRVLKTNTVLPDDQCAAETPKIAWKHFAADGD